MKKKIAILLPYKENYSPTYPGAVSLFVHSTTKISKFKNDITIFGFTDLKDKFSEKYINIPLKKNELLILKVKSIMSVFNPV